MKQALNNVDETTGLLRGTFGIGTFEVGGRIFPGVVKPNGGVIDISKEYHDTHAIFDDWSRAFDRLHDLAEMRDGEFEFASVRPLPPLAHPNLLCAGANYKQHVAEMLTYNDFNQHNRKPGESDEDFFKRNYAFMEERQRSGTPFVWTSLHSALIGANDDVPLPVVGHQHDWELELGVVVARSKRFATREEAADLIAGYMIVNDLGSVDLARREDVPFQFDWICKHQPGFKPAGPFIVPACFIKLDETMHIKLKVNGVVKQDWPVTDMIFGPADFLSYLSERIRLMPGDLLITGSPPGNGRTHGHFLADGDIIESEIAYLGRQRNRCQAEDTRGRKPIFDYMKHSTR